ncbi:MAG: hypothetical protein C0514_08335 [Candidatus Puniceispirillum sp.]|nr:hypothetical protein [Candidatus Puniceispirillum sp.]
MKKIICFAAALATLAPLAAKAERLHIVNENKKALAVKVRASGDPLTEELAEKRVTIPQEHFFDFTVSPADLNGKSLYDIVGDTNPVAMGGTCKNLRVEQKYKIVFTNDTVGTSCIATPMD